MPEILFSWVAQYKDGRMLCQYRKDGTENKYTSIERDKLAFFIVKHHATKRNVLIVHFFRPTQKLIWRQRPGKDFFSGKERYRVWVVGWQENRNGVNVQMVSILFEDGHVEIMDQFREDHVIYNKPEKYLPCELTETP